MQRALQRGSVSLYLYWHNPWLVRDWYRLVLFPRASAFLAPRASKGLGIVASYLHNRLKVLRLSCDLVLLSKKKDRRALTAQLDSEIRRGDLFASLAVLWVKTQHEYLRHVSGKLLLSHRESKERSKEWRLSLKKFQQMRRKLVFVDTHPEDNFPVVYTDGSFRGRALGSGGFFGDNDSRNFAIGAAYTGQKHCSMRAELNAMIHAISITKGDLEIRSDCQSLVNQAVNLPYSIGKSDIGKMMSELYMAIGKRQVRFSYVPAHVHVHGNHQADLLARKAGALFSRRLKEELQSLTKTTRTKALPKSFVSEKIGTDSIVFEAAKLKESLSDDANAKSSEELKTRVKKVEVHILKKASAKKLVKKSKGKDIPKQSQPMAPQKIIKAEFVKAPKALRRKKSLEKKRVQKKKKNLSRAKRILFRSVLRERQGWRVSPKVVDLVKSITEFELASEDAQKVKEKSSVLKRKAKKKAKASVPEQPKSILQLLYSPKVIASSLPAPPLPKFTFSPMLVTSKAPVTPMLSTQQKAKLKNKLLSEIHSEKKARIALKQAVVEQKISEKQMTKAQSANRETKKSSQKQSQMTIQESQERPKVIPESQRKSKAQNVNLESKNKSQTRTVNLEQKLLKQTQQMKSQSQDGKKKTSKKAVNHAATVVSKADPNSSSKKKKKALAQETSKKKAYKPKWKSSIWDKDKKNLAKWDLIGREILSQMRKDRLRV